MTLNMIAMNCRFSAVGIAHNVKVLGDSSRLTHNIFSRLFRQTRVIRWGGYLVET